MVTKLRLLFSLSLAMFVCSMPGLQQAATSSTAINPELQTALAELKIAMDNKCVSPEDQEKLSTAARFYHLDSDVRKKYNLTQPNGILLMGPQGTGKTVLVTTFVKVIKGHLIEFTAADLASPTTIAAAFKRAREKAAELGKLRPSTPVVLFMDEVDDKAKPSSETLNQLLVEINSKKNTNIQLIAATNYAHVLAPAFIRWQRFDYHIYVPLPKGPARLRLLNEELAKIDPKLIALDDTNKIHVAKKTRGHAPAGIASLVERAKHHAAKQGTPVNAPAFLYALEHTPVNPVPSTSSTSFVARLTSRL